MEPEKSGEVEKHGLHKEVVHDHDVLGNKQVTMEDAAHAAELTAEEHALERKLRIKIDLMIMPWVILVSCLIIPFDCRAHVDLRRESQVYLLNYIDRNSASRDLLERES